MTQADRDAASELLKCAADDWIAGIRHLQGALLGVDEMLADDVRPFRLACAAWYRVSQMVMDSDMPRWPLVALEAAQLLEDGWTPR